MSKYLQLNEVKEIQINLLDFVKTTLLENDIQFWLDSGTLLGSIRHRGYIPWDDDIDIIIRRRDYDKAIDLLNSRSEHYKVLTMNNTEDFFYLFAKVTDSRTHIVEKNLKEIQALGVYIDIFPLDSLPGNEKEYKKLIDDVFRYRSILYYSLLEGEYLKHSTIKTKIKHLFGRLYGTRRAMEKVDNLCRTSSKINDTYAANIVAASSKNRKVPAYVFDETLQGEFEGKEYPIPKGYDQYLKILYGDYMKLPPETERVLTHDFKAYLLS